MKMSERERNAVRDLIAATIECVVDIGRSVTTGKPSDAKEHADLIVKQIEILGAEEEEQNAAQRSRR